MRRKAELGAMGEDKAAGSRDQVIITTLAYHHPSGNKRLGDLRISAESSQLGKGQSFDQEGMKMTFVENVPGARSWGQDEEPHLASAFLKFLL